MKDDKLTGSLIRAASAFSEVLAVLLDELDDAHLEALSDAIAAGARPGLRFVARTGSQAPEVTLLLLDARGVEMPFARSQAVHSVQ